MGKMWSFVEKIWRNVWMVANDVIYLHCARKWGGA